MVLCTLRNATIITVVRTYSKQDILLGLDHAAYNEDATCIEALLNTHDLRDNRVIVHDIAKKHSSL